MGWESFFKICERLGTIVEHVKFVQIWGIHLPKHFRSTPNTFNHSGNSWVHLLAHTVADRGHITCSAPTIKLTFPWVTLLICATGNGIAGLQVIFGSVQHRRLFPCLWSPINVCFHSSDKIFTIAQTNSNCSTIWHDNNEFLVVWAFAEGVKIMITFFCLDKSLT